jgi:glycosyltransferase involved in cell wall biosynthesis
VKLKFAGPKQSVIDIPDEDYLGELQGKAKWEMLQKAYAVIAPGGVDHAPRVPLEAAAAGVPTLGMIYDGTHEHIKNGVSGFHADTVETLGKFLLAIPHLNSEDMRQWVSLDHNYDKMVEAYETACKDVIRGERW